jgi:hypothetical protein
MSRDNDFVGGEIQALVSLIGRRITQKDTRYGVGS